MNKILDFYKQTSPYTDLGFYRDFANRLPNDIKELARLQRMQIIHPIIIWNSLQDGWWDDLTKVPKTSIVFEDDIFPTAMSMLAELLRRDKNYSVDRKVEDKIHVTCRGEAVLLASILKAKGIPTRVRSGFAEYLRHDEIYYDHWITEYYSYDKNRWVLVDADNQWGDTKIDFDLNDIPRDKFLFSAEAYLNLRNNKMKENEIVYASDPVTIGLPATIRALFYDFHSLMNDEIIFDFVPRYVLEKNFNLTEDELKELDELANLMLEPDNNFKKLQEIWDNNLKFRTMAGGLN